MQDIAELSAFEGQYPGLVERAVACIDANGGVLDESSLIAAVFGGGGSTALWRPLLRTVLATHPQLILRSDGAWTNRSQAVGTSRFPTDFVVLDVETTGLKPTSNRVIEVAIIRVTDGVVTQRWSTLVNPGRQIPKYIVGKIGIDDKMVADAPEFRSVAPTLVELIGDVPIVGHNIGFDLGFVNHELKRCGLPQLVNTPLDTLTLTAQLVPSVRRFALSDVARALGVGLKGAHRAMNDAEMTMDVFRVLLQHAEDRGLATIDDLLKTSARATGRRRVRKPAGRTGSLLDRSMLADIPHRPGVYIMRDKDRRVLYIGKAKNLRKRVGSYYSQPLGYTRKMDGLIELLAEIQVEVVGTELEALLLESQLIRRYRPRFNTVQRNAEQYVFVKVDITNPWPRVTTSRDRADDGALYYGPFKSSGRARDAVDLVNEVLPLRTCRRSFKDARSLGSPCIELGLGKCMGPCVGQADADEYRQHINAIVAFFSGDDRPLIARMHAALETTVKTRDFERAARLRDRILATQRLAQEQHELDGAERFERALLVLPSDDADARTIWYLVRNWRWAALEVHDGDKVQDVRDRLRLVHERANAEAGRLAMNHHAVDELSILARWMRKTPEHPALISLDGRELDDALMDALDVDLSIPFGEAPGSSDDDVQDAE